MELLGGRLGLIGGRFGGRFLRGVSGVFGKSLEESSLLYKSPLYVFFLFSLEVEVQVEVDFDSVASSTSRRPLQFHHTRSRLLRVTVLGQKQKLHSSLFQGCRSGEQGRAGQGCQLGS